MDKKEIFRSVVLGAVAGSISGLSILAAQTLTKSFLLIAVISSVFLVFCLVIFWKFLK